MSEFRRSDADHYGQFWTTEKIYHGDIDCRDGRIVNLHGALYWECSATYLIFRCGDAAFSTWAEARRVGLQRLRERVEGQIDAAALSGADVAGMANHLARLRAARDKLEAAVQPPPHVAPVYATRADVMAIARRQRG